MKKEVLDMATLVPVSTTLRLAFQTSVDGNGNPVLRTRSFNRVKTTALAQDILDVANAIASLQEYPLSAVKKADLADITA